MTNYDLLDAKWRKSARSQQSGACVEVADNLSGIVAVRDSKNARGAALAFTPGEWAAFVSAVKSGTFDRA